MVERQGKDVLQGRMEKIRNKVGRIVLVSCLITLLELLLSNASALAIWTTGLPHDRVLSENEYTVSREDGEIRYTLSPMEGRIQNLMLYCDAEATISVDVAAVMVGSAAVENIWPTKYAVLGRNSGILGGGRTAVRVPISAPEEFLQTTVTVQGLGDEQLDGLVVNSTAKMFNLYRWLLMLAVYAGVLVLKKLWRVPLRGRGPLLFNVVFWAAFLILFTVSQYSAEPLSLVFDDAQVGAFQEAPNSIARSLLDGKVWHEDPVDPRLIAMEDPYDYTLRTEEGISYPFDESYYQGKYYSYFGVGPVLTLLIPFRLLTGHYLPILTANLLLMIGTTFLLAWLYDRLMKKYLLAVNMTLYLLGFSVLMIASGFLQYMRGQKYDLCNSSALFYVCASLLLMLRFLDREDSGVGTMTLCGMTTGMIVLSKPNYIMHYLILFYILFLALQKRGKDGKGVLRYVVCYAVPLALCAAFQMWYNAARFGNALEFGNIYQLGANIRLYTQLDLFKSLKILLVYFFSLPGLTVDTFPFLTKNMSATIMGWGRMSLHELTVGLVCIPILYPLLFRKELENRIAAADVEWKKLRRPFSVVLAAGLGNLIICSCVTSSNDAYMVDTRLGFLMVSMLLLMKVQCLKPGSTLVRKVILGLMLSSMVIMLPLSLQPSYKEFLAPAQGDWNIILKNIIEIWS